MKHAVLSPSSSNRWMNCSGSVQASVGVPDPETPAAREGTFAHEIAALCLKSGTNAATMIGTAKEEFVVDAEFADAVQEYLDAVRECPGKLIGVEVEVHLKSEGLADVWGTADAFVLDGSVLHVFDLKFGAGVHVDVEDNSQQKIYAIGALDSLPPGIAGAIREVVLHVVQPRHHKGGHTDWKILVTELRNWALTTLRKAVEATKVKNPWLSAGAWCQFCRVKPTCPKFREQALAAGAAVFDDVATMTPAKVPPDPRALSPEQLATCLKGFDLLEKWMHAVREHAYEKVANGTVTIPGFKLVQKVGNRRWIDEAKAAEFLELFLPAGASVMTDPKPELLSPAQAEKQLKKSDRHLMEQLTQKPTTGTVLVPETDTRPAVIAADVFGDGTLPEPTDADQL